MKRKFYVLFILSVIVFILIQCGKKEETDVQTVNKSVKVDVKEDIRYVKEFSINPVYDRDDLFVDLKDLQRADYSLLRFGDKVVVKQNIVLKNEKDESIQCYYFVTDSGDKLWSIADNFVEGFVTVIGNEGVTYEIPDENYATEFKLKKGHFGFFLREYNGWFNVDFKGYAVKSEEDDMKWIGNQWVNCEVTMDVKTAVEAYYLYLGDYYTLKGNESNAHLNYKRAYDNRSGDDSVLLSVINSRLSRFESDSDEAEGE